MSSPGPLPPEKVRAVREWHRQRTELGGIKKACARIGVTEHQVRGILSRGNYWRVK